MEVNGDYYFAANDGIGGSELWKSDGTTAGTVQVADIRPGAAGSSPRPLANLNGTLYFTADSGSSSLEFWRTDGAAAGTSVVAELSDEPLYQRHLASVDDRLFLIGVSAYASDHTLVWENPMTPGSMPQQVGEMKMALGFSFRYSVTTFEPGVKMSRSRM